MVATEENDGDAGDVLRYSLRGLDTRSIRHVDVEEHDVGDDVFRTLIRFASRRHLGHHRVAECCEKLHEQRPCVVVILGDQDADLGSFTHLARICISTERSASLIADALVRRLVLRD